MAQKFSKNDSDENKFFAVWEAMLEETFADLQNYFTNVEKSKELGEALWEAQVVDVWKIIEKKFFVKIFDELIKAGYFAGTIDTYCRILFALFGEDADINIVIESPLELTINVTAEYSNFAQFITQSGGAIITAGGFPIVFTTLLNDISESQITALLNSIKNAGTKVNFILN